MTINSSANSVILILFAFSDNLSAENSKSSADFFIQLIQLLECMGKLGCKLTPDNVHEVHSIPMNSSDVKILLCLFPRARY